MVPFHSHHVHIITDQSWIPISGVTRHVARYTWHETRGTRHGTRVSLLPGRSVPGLRPAGAPAPAPTSRGGVVSTPAPAPADAGGLGGDLVIEAIQGLGLAAVHVKPPIADEVGLGTRILLMKIFRYIIVDVSTCLVEDGAVGAEEAVGDEATLGVPQGAEVEHLALRCGVRVLPALNLQHRE